MQIQRTYPWMTIHREERKKKISKKICTLFCVKRILYVLYVAVIDATVVIKLPQYFLSYKRIGDFFLSYFLFVFSMPIVYDLVDCDISYFRMITFEFEEFQRTKFMPNVIMYFSKIQLFSNLCECNVASHLPYTFRCIVCWTAHSLQLWAPVCLNRTQLCAEHKTEWERNKYQIEQQLLNKTIHFSRIG